jgi:class 3 adenylate cyclase
MIPGRCEACDTPALTDARFCSNCGRRLWVAAEPATPAEPVHAAVQRRQLTVMFCDLVGSSALSAALDPEDFSDIIAAFHRVVTDVTAGHGGFVARYMGDGALIWFGYPRAEEDDAERAVHAALKIVDAVGALTVEGGPRLHVRIGMATGLVVVGDMATSGAARNLDVVGETPNLAARLQDLAEPDTILASGNLQGLVDHLFQWRACGRRTIKGWDKPVPVWQVLRRAPVADRFRARTGARAAPLLGRTAIVERLVTLWHAARAGSGRVVLITGGAGIGKSRLVAHMAGITTAESVTRVRLFCSRQQQAVPLQPVIEQLTRLARLSPDGTPEVELAKLAAAIQGADTADMALFAELFGLQTRERKAAMNLTPLRKKRLLTEAIVGILLRAAALRPVLAICEDAHWADPTTLEVLTRTVRSLAGLPIMLVVTARPSFEPRWQNDPGVERIVLAPLCADEAATLVHWTAGTQVLPEGTVQDILARADGVPLYIEELTKTILTTNAPAPDRPATARVPTSLQASLNARLDRLGSAREIAEVAAVIGRTFGLDLLAQVAVSRATTLDDALNGLVDSGIVAPYLPGQYHFHHALLHDAAYDMITRERRRWLHGRIAAAIETHLPKFGEAEPQVLALHWSEAGDLARAATAWGSAARQALRRSAPREALAAIESGLAALRGLAPDPQAMRTEIELRVLQVSSVSLARGPGVPVMGLALTRMIELSRELPDTPYLLFAHYSLWLHAFTRGELESAHLQVVDLIHYADQRPGPGRLLCAVRAAGLTDFATGSFGASADHLERGIALYEPAIRPVFARLTVHDPVIDMHCYRSWDLLFLGRLRQAHEESALALSEARQSDHVFTLAHAMLTVAFVHLHCGEIARGMQQLDELFVLTEEQGIPYFQQAGLVFKGYYEGRVGDAAAGQVLVRAAIDWNTETNTLLYLPGFIACEAELLAILGDTDTAMARVDEALATMQSSGARWDEVEIRTIHGNVCRMAGDMGGAEAAYWRAVDVARQQRAGLRELRAATSLAHMLAGGERADSAHRALAAALEHFVAEPEIPVVANARALLSWLEQSSQAIS